MARVMASGVFDLIHIGHLHYLEEAKKYGDVLIVILARTVTISSRKRDPIMSEKERLEMMNHITIVDLALLGHETDHLSSVDKVKPDIIAIGADQHYDLGRLRQDLAKRGLGTIKVVRLKSEVEGLSTTSLINRILARFQPKENEPQVSEKSDHHFI